MEIEGSFFSPLGFFLKSHATDIKGQVMFDLSPCSKRKYCLTKNMICMCFFLICKHAYNFIWCVFFFNGSFKVEICEKWTEFDMLTAAHYTGVITCVTLQLAAFSK